jgi:hypothetical protein
MAASPHRLDDRVPDLDRVLLDECRAELARHDVVVGPVDEERTEAAARARVLSDPRGELVCRTDVGYQSAAAEHRGFAVVGTAGGVDTGGHPGDAGVVPGRCWSQVSVSQRSGGAT